MKKINWYESIAPPSENDILEVEKKFNIKFPKEYLEIVYSHHGSMPKESLFDANDSTYQVGWFLTLTKSDQLSLPETMYHLAEFFGENIIPFASDPGGDFICFDYRESKTPKIVYWQRDYAQPEPYDALFPVADDFASFINMLYEDDDI